ncbi:MAG TPA: hypothetical protein VLR89_01515 [Anaerolineaceae bacterium]|nr:hypothetical protein [Anaerolineaceae bacterium]
MGTLLQDGIDAAKSGRMEEALQLLRRSAEENPQNADVWVWLSAIIDDEEKQTEFLQKALEIDPENKPAQRGMAFLKRKKFIAPKPGETLSDHTRPIGVFKGGADKANVQQPVVPLVPIDSQPSVVSADVEAPVYDPDTENTIPPDLTDNVELEEKSGDAFLEEKVPTIASADLEEVPIIEDSVVQAEESLSEVVEEPEQDDATRDSPHQDFDAGSQAGPEEVLGDQATQVSAVISDAVSSANEEMEEEVEPELDQELQVNTQESTEEEESQKIDEKLAEHPFITEAKHLKWQLLLYGLILTAFIIIGILVGSTLKNLISPQKQGLSMNIEPIAKQNGVFLLEGQEFRRLNILKEFPKEDVGLIITSLDSPQIILKDQMVADTTKLKLLDPNQTLISSQVKLLESKIPVLESDSTLSPGRYCVSYELGSGESQAMYWCFVKN